MKKEKTSNETPKRSLDQMMNALYRAEVGDQIKDAINLKASISQWGKSIVL